MRHLMSPLDFSVEELDHLLDLAHEGLVGLKVLLGKKALALPHLFRSLVLQLQKLLIRHVSHTSISSCF